MGKKVLTIPQLRMLSGKSPMAVEESKNRIEDSIGQTGTPDHQPTVDIGKETDAAAIIEQVAANTTDSDGEDAGATGEETSLTIDPTHAEVGTAELNTAPANTIATNDKDIIDTTMSTERHTAQNSAVAVIGDNESPAVSVSNSTASSRHSESPEGGLIRHAPTFINPGDYGRPADDEDDDEAYYMGAKESGLLYQEKSESRYPTIVTKPGWNEVHERAAVMDMSPTHPADLASTMERAYKVVVGPRFAIKDTMVARSQHGIGGNYGDRPIESRLSLLLSLYPELQHDILNIFAREFEQDGMTTKDVYEFFYKLRIEKSSALYMHVWRRNYEVSLQYVKIPRDSVTSEEYASSFLGHPESIWSFVVEGDRGGFVVPSIADRTWTRT